MSKNVLTVIDFFCGAGGFSEGFRRSGYDIIMGIDNWQPAILTHNANHNLNDSVKNILDFEDIEEIKKLPNSDIIIGSPPCVLFSLSNHGGNANKDLGIRLIRAFYKVIAVKKFQKNSKLKAWLMENVPNSRNYVQEQYTFADLGLKKWAVSQGLAPDAVAIRAKSNGAILNSDDYGAGQKRKRFVCGELVETGAFPEPDKMLPYNPPTLRKLFSGFPSPLGKNAHGKVQDPNYDEISVNVEEFRDHFYDTGVYEVEWQKAREAKQNHAYMGRMSFPENVDKPSRTIMATRSASTREAVLYESELGRIGDGEYRLPTVREIATIMGFPITYQFYGDESTKWRLVGNAVSVQLSFALANKIKEKLGLELKADDRLHDFAGFGYLDTHTERIFDNPPKRNKDALFRVHTIKSGNMTVDLTNRNQATGADGWCVIAHVGTGRGYRSVVIKDMDRFTAKEILETEAEDFLKKLNKVKQVRAYSKEELDRKNEEYGLVSDDSEHPYNIVKVVRELVLQETSHEDALINMNGCCLEAIKPMMPLSQVMSIYALGLIVS